MCPGESVFVTDKTESILFSNSVLQENGQRPETAMEVCGKSFMELQQEIGQLHPSEGLLMGTVPVQRIVSTMFVNNNEFAVVTLRDLSKLKEMSRRLLEVEQKEQRALEIAARASLEERAVRAEASERQLQHAATVSSF